VIWADVVGLKRQWWNIRSVVCSCFRDGIPNAKNARRTITHLSRISCPPEYRKLHLLPKHSCSLLLLLLIMLWSALCWQRSTWRYTGPV